MTDQTENREASPASAAQDALAKRRRLLKAGLGSATVLATLASRSATAGFMCQSPSAFGSVTHSGPTGQTTYCSGGSPGYWKNHLGEWPAQWPPMTIPSRGLKATLFVNVTGKPGPFKSSETLLGSLGVDVNVGNKDGSINLSLYPNQGGPVAVGRHVAAAMLNAATNRVPQSVLSTDKIRKIWDDYLSHGYYEVSPGIKWYEQDIIDYIKSTMS